MPKKRHIAYVSFHKEIPGEFPTQRYGQVSKYLFRRKILATTIVDREAHAPKLDELLRSNDWDAVIIASSDELTPAAKQIIYSQGRSIVDVNRVNGRRWLLAFAAVAATLLAVAQIPRLIASRAA